MSRVTQVPRIGLTTYREPARWGRWHQPADLLPATYADAVVAAGGVPILLPPVDPALAPTAVEAVDGVLISGGADVDPARYSAERDPHTDPPRSDRDSWELAVVRAVLESNLPLLGVCRGMQVLNVALGGTLVQHLPDAVGSDVHSPSPGSFGRHDVRLERGGRLADVIGETTVIATHHHQSVDALGAGLVACAWADDRTIEAVELPDNRWVFGVQWHPEAHCGEALFDAFVAASGARR